MAAAAECQAAASRSAAASPAAAFREGRQWDLARRQEGCRQREEALVRRQKEEVLEEGPVRRQKEEVLEEGPVRQQEEGLARHQKEADHLQQEVVLPFSKELVCSGHLFQTLRISVQLQLQSKLRCTETISF